MNELKIALLVVISVFLFVGALAGLIEYLPTNIVVLYEDTSTVCVQKKGFGYDKPEKYCGQLVVIK